MGSIVAIQFTPPIAGDGYVTATMTAKARLGYIPFHRRCWDVPMWAVGILQHMREPNFILLDKPKVVPHSVVFGSVMECHLAYWEEMVAINPNTHFVLGGYTKPIDGVWWCDTELDGWEMLAVLQGDSIPTRHNNMYPRLGTVANGVRVQLSTGCSHSCDFCMVPGKGQAPIPKQPLALQRETDGIGQPVGIVYVDDKTFGQASNWRDLAMVNRWLRPAGFVVQTTALQVTQLGAEGMAEWQAMGIIAVEIGVESYNDDILKRYRKPARVTIIDKAVDLITQAGMKVCPNIIVGMAGETAESYCNTQRFMERVPQLGWFNMYCLADYSGSGEDVDESSPLKSWQSSDDRGVATQAYHDLYQTAIARMT